MQEDLERDGVEAYFSNAAIFAALIDTLAKRHTSSSQSACDEVETVDEDSIGLRHFCILPVVM